MFSDFNAIKLEIKNKHLEKHPMYLEINRYSKQLTGQREKQKTFGLDNRPCGMQLNQFLEIHSFKAYIFKIKLKGLLGGSVS